MVEVDIQHNGSTQRYSTGDDGLLPDVDPVLRKALRENENLRDRWSRIRISQFAEKARQHNLVILSQWTFEQLMDIIEGGSDPDCPEVVRVLVEMAYAGKSFESTGSKVSGEIAVRHLKEAMIEAGLKMKPEEFETIDLDTIRNTFMLYRLAKKAGVNLRDFPIKIL